MNSVKEKQDWKHEHQNVDSGYFWVVQMGWEEVSVRQVFLCTFSFLFILNMH